MPALARLATVMSSVADIGMIVVNGGIPVWICTEMGPRDKIASTP
jgi:hypothetical protein